LRQPNLGKFVAPCGALFMSSDRIQRDFYQGLSHKKEMKKFLSTLTKFSILAVVGLFVVWVFIFNWSFVFKKKIVGEVVAVERVMGSMAIITQSQNQQINPQAFSFSVGIKDKITGEIHMASSEDRKWAAVTKGNCVVAAFFPYPPWRTFDKGMTDHNARLLRNYTSCAEMSETDGFFEALRFFLLAY
jgi:hypothetical protein